MPDVEVEGPDGKTYQFPDGTDKNAAIKYFRAKGIGNPKPPIAAPTGTPSLATAGNNRSSMNEVELFSGREHQPGSISESVGSVVGGALKSAAYTAAMAPTAIHRSLQSSGVMGAKSRLFPGEHTTEQIEKEDLPNAAITTLTGVAEGMDAPTPTITPRGRTVPEPPRTVPLDPEAQAKYTAAIDKTNAEFKEGSKAYHEKVSKEFDEAKRAQVQWDRKQRLEQGAKEATKATHENLQRTYATARGALDQRWGQFRQGMEGAELEPTEAFNNIEDAKAKYLRGSPSSLTVFNNLAREMGIQEFMEGDGGQLKAIPGSGALPFDTARVHYSAIGDRLAQGDLPGNVYQALKSVSDGLDRQLTKAAKGRGLSKEYSALKGDESQFRSDWKDPKSPLTRAYKALDPNFLEPHVMGRGNEYLTKQLERYREHGAQPHLPLSARRLMEASKAIKAKPGLPEGTMPKAPELREVPRPKPKPEEAQKASKWVRKGGRIAGKIVGGGLGSATGHPFIGYSVGGELGEAAVDQIARRRKTVPPPPDE